MGALGTRESNGLEVLFQVSSKVAYPAFDVMLSEPAIFKLILNTAVSGDTVAVTLADGSALTCDAILLDAMNAQVIEVKSVGSTVLITEFGLFR